jgi:competence protein ComEC
LSWQRARASHAIDRIFRDDAPLAKALLIADQHEIPKDIKDRYATAGIIHMLSISGLHVAIIAMAIELLIHVARLPARVAKATSVVVVMVYVAVIGFPPPALRSGVMVAVSAGSAAMQRPTSRWAALAVGAFIPLCVPRTILDLGYQLSVGGIAGLIASAGLARRYIAPRFSGRRAQVATGVLASVVATLVSAPLVAYAFGRISMIAPMTNMLADPVLSLAQPMLFLALLLAPVPALAYFVADAVHPLLALFDAIATSGAAVPFAALAVAPTRGTAIVAGIASAATIVASVSRFPARPALVALGALAALCWFGTCS